MGFGGSAGLLLARVSFSSSSVIRRFLSIVLVLSCSTSLASCLCIVDKDLARSLDLLFSSASFNFRDSSFFLNVDSFWRSSLVVVSLVSWRFCGCSCSLFSGSYVVFVFFFFVVSSVIRCWGAICWVSTHWQQVWFPSLI